MDRFDLIEVTTMDRFELIEGITQTLLLEAFSDLADGLL
jgi:hypothetical protein